MKRKSKQNIMETRSQKDLMEQYWSERSEKGRNLPEVPANCERLVRLLSEEIQASLSKMRDTIDYYERYSILRQVYATQFPIDLTILTHLRDDLANLAEETNEGFHTMLDVNDYWRWCCCNEPDGAQVLRKEMDALVKQGSEMNRK